MKRSYLGIHLIQLGAKRLRKRGEPGAQNSKGETGESASKRQIRHLHKGWEMEVGEDECPSLST